MGRNKHEYPADAGVVSTWDEDQDRIASAHGHLRRIAHFDLHSVPTAATGEPNWEWVARFFHGVAWEALTDE